MKTVESTEESLARYAEEQAALHELTARLQHAANPTDIYAIAIDAMFRALNCQRASVLLFDDSNVMRFVASRGLSEEYCRAVEGHSPWSPATRDARPIVIEDVANADLSAELKATVRDEGIAALAFIPLQDIGGLLGKFMVYYDAPRAFDARQTDMAVTIARHVTSSLGRLRAQRAALHLSAIVESSDDAIISKDLDGIITSWNRSAERLYGYAAGEAIGKPVTLIIPPDRSNEDAAILKRIRQGERVEHYETVRRHKDGSLVDISLTVSPIKDSAGNIIGASKIARDIRGRKAAHAKLMESERRATELLSAIPAAIYTTDAEGKITYFNDMAVELLGRVPVLGSNEWHESWKLFRPDGTPLPRDQYPLAVALREGRPVRGIEALLERPDGTRVPYIPYPTPIRDSSGKLVGAINMLVDISQRKEAETQQRVLLDELNHRVKNNMQMLQSLLSAAARRARNPDARASLEEAVSRVSAMSAAQRNLYGKKGSSFNAAEFLQAVCETSSQTFSSAVDIECDTVDAQLPNDIAMPLSLIIHELLTNAVKHAAGKGVAIKVRLTRDQGKFLLCVEDGGPGFDFAEARGHASGLLLVEGLARQIGGKFKVARSPVSSCCVEFTEGAVR